MALTGTILAGVALAIGALNGLRRGAVKEGLALIGILLGAILVTLWATRWGALVSRRTSWQPGTGQWIAAMGLLWGTALLSGYGSGALVPRRAGRIPSTLRAGGAVLGLLNVALLLSFTLRYTQFWLYGESADARKTTWIRNAVWSNFLLDRFDLILLGVAWAFAVVSLVVLLVRLTRRLITPQRQPAPNATGTPGKPAAPAASGGLFPPSNTAASRGGAPTQPVSTSPGMQPSFLEKPRSPGQ